MVPILLESVPVALIYQGSKSLSHIVGAEISVLYKPLGQFPYSFECLTILDDVLV